MNVSVQGPNSVGEFPTLRINMFGAIGLGINEIFRVTVCPVVKFKVLPKPVVPAFPLDTTELAPIRINCPDENPIELMPSFSKFMNGVVIVTGVAIVLVAANARKATVPCIHEISTCFLQSNL